jgi:hypothetical protein
MLASNWLSNAIILAAESARLRNIALTKCAPYRHRPATARIKPDKPLRKPTIHTEDYPFLVQIQDLINPWLSRRVDS